LFFFSDNINQRLCYGMEQRFYHLFILYPSCLLAVVTFCRIVQKACTSAATCCNIATSNTVHYGEITVWHCVLLPATLWTLPLLVVSLVIFSYLWTVLSFLMFPLIGKVLQTIELLTRVKGTSSSWINVFQPKESKLHAECKSHDRLWRVQYSVYASYCWYYNSYTRITEHHTSCLGCTNSGL
jgi:hypothetical protein